MVMLTAGYLIYISSLSWCIMCKLGAEGILAIYFAIACLYLDCGTVSFTREDELGHYFGEVLCIDNFLGGLA